MAVGNTVGKTRRGARMAAVWGLIGLAGLTCSAQAHPPNAAAPVQISQAWVRATVAGQKATGAFMTLQARENLRLVGVRSPVAGVAEVHEMRMEGDVMRMRALSVLALPAGQTVELKPGAYHIMLLDLKQPLKAGEQVPLELLLETEGTGGGNAAHQPVLTQPVQAEVRELTAGMPGPAMPPMHAH